MLCELVILRVGKLPRVAQTDAFAAHYYGFPALIVMSQAPDGKAPHYHLAIDTPENIDGASLERCYCYLRRDPGFERCTAEVLRVLDRTVGAISTIEKAGRQAVLAD